MTSRGAPSGPERWRLVSITGFFEGSGPDIGPLSALAKKRNRGRGFRRAWRHSRCGKGLATASRAFSLAARRGGLQRRMMEKQLQACKADGLFMPAALAKASFRQAADKNSQSLRDQLLFYHLTLRRGRDSNPRNRFMSVWRISSALPSTTRPPLRGTKVRKNSVLENYLPFFSRMRVRSWAERSTTWLRSERSSHSRARSYSRMR